MHAFKVVKWRRQTPGERVRKKLTFLVSSPKQQLWYCSTNADRHAVCARNHTSLREFVCFFRYCTFSYFHIDTFQIDFVNLTLHNSDTRVLILGYPLEVPRNYGNRTTPTYVTLR